MKVAGKSLLLIACVTTGSIMSTPAHAGGIGSITKRFRSPIRRPVVRTPKFNRPSFGKFTAKFHSARRGAARSVQRRLPRITNRDVRREGKRFGGIASKAGKGIVRGFFSKGGPRGSSGGRYGSKQTPEDSRGDLTPIDKRRKANDEEYGTDDNETHPVDKPKSVAGSWLTRKRTTRGRVRINRSFGTIRFQGHRGRSSYLRKPTVRYRSSTRRSYRR